MEQIVVKAEMQPNEEILLFYVDEDGGNEEGVITTVQNIEQGNIIVQQDNNSYIVENVGELTNTVTETQEQSDSSQCTELHKDRWTDSDTKKLLVFYVDNREAFLNGITRKKHLWTVACKTILPGKNMNSCEMKLRNLKKKYAQALIEKQKGISVIWACFDLCHQAFHDDSFVLSLLSDNTVQPERVVTLPVQTKPNDDGIIVVKKVNTKRPSANEKVEMMLNLYMKHRKTYQKDQKTLWEVITQELLEDDPEFWHRRFLNFKQHYIRLFEKRQENGPQNVNWPYTEIFDKIFEDDEDFQRKHAPKPVNIESIFSSSTEVVSVLNIEATEHYEWDTTEITVLVKYYFDCFDEFKDPTIPNNFLWNEVGRLLDKSPTTCKEKYAELKAAHLDKYINTDYTLRTRVPFEIIFDNIICKEMQIALDKTSTRPEQTDVWKVIELDVLVQFFYDNIEPFKDRICHFVCWLSVSKKLNKTVHSCKRQWEDLVTLYKTILEDKKENPDMQIDWRYIEIFDRIFDYGMDTRLIEGYDEEYNQKNNVRKIGVKKVNINLDEDNIENGIDDDDEYDEKGFGKRSKRSGDSKAFKILEFYHKNKDKFSTTQRKKQALWELLAKQIGISAEQCAHRFRNLKQVYMGYIQREINKPEMPILWPYYALCKKVFGYRALKAKLKNGRNDSDEAEEWAAKEIKQLINYFGQNFDVQKDDDVDDKSKWTALAREIGKSDSSCRDKFIELRRSYRKLTTMRARNPELKLSWKYFNMIDAIFSSEGAQTSEEVMEVDDLTNDEGDNNEQGEEDFQCIIVIPEGQDMSDMSEANIQIITNTETPTENELESKPSVTKWTKRTKKKLLILYFKYCRASNGKEINSTEMWNEIASKLPNKTPLSCRKMFAKLKRNHKVVIADVNQKKTPYYTVLQKILALKPTFIKTSEKKSLQEGKTYKDVPLPAHKVQQALEYYLQHIDEFLNPRFEKKYLWTQLANIVSEPMMKLFNKINYLKQTYTENEDSAERTPFSDLVKEILTRENVLNGLLTKEPKPVIGETEEPSNWSDDETEQLLKWYLTNLEKFKNPKYVRSYLWREVSDILKKSPLTCSKKMLDVRTQYRTMVRENPEALNSWRFYDLCQKIYGTGKKGSNVNSAEVNY